LIWGVASFGWGSLNAWAKRSAIRELDNALALTSPPLNGWLQGPLAPLDPLLADPVLLSLPKLALGLASPAAQRWVDETTLQPALKDMILADFLTGRTLYAAGNSAPPAELLTRIGGLKPLTAQPLLVASGRSNAMFYFVQPLPDETHMMLILPQSLRQLAGFAPQVVVPPSTTVTLNFPHANGQWARWNPIEPLSLETVPLNTLEDPLDLAIRRNVSGFGEVVIQAQWQGAYPPPPLMGFIAVTGWAILMSMAVLWRWLSPWVAVGQHMMSPILTPVVGGAKKVLGPLSQLNFGIAGVLKTLKKPILALISIVVPKWGEALHEDANDWRKSGNDEADNPTLTEGPGAFAADDFTAAAATVTHNESTKIAKLKVLKPLEHAYTADRHGSGNTATHDERLTDEVSREEENDTLTARVLRCMNEGLVELLYQPMYMVTDGSVYANEVLARLADNEGQISPAQFLPILGSLGKLSELDALVFEKVMKQHFTTKGVSTALSLNISGNSLEDLGYLREVATQGQGVLKHLIFEVRSNEVVRDPNALKLLKTLQRQGAKIAIDYFGGSTGMVQATHAIGLDLIKADAKRVSDKVSKKDLLEMCLAAAKLNLPVVLEKVEDAKTEDFARRAGVKYLQGYSLSKPAPTLTTLPLSARLNP
jgi:EAL domain-containing protein (putative c-di-GMP-specific phosphodiesterase class I)